MRLGNTFDLRDIVPLGFAKDGMDQAKWSVPRSKGLRLSKSTSCQPRPRFKVQGVWLHGALLRLFVIHPQVPSDSSTIIECATRCLEDLDKACKEKAMAFPSEVLAWVTELQLVGSLDGLVWIGESPP